MRTRGGAVVAIAVALSGCGAVDFESSTAEFQSVSDRRAELGEVGPSVPETTTTIVTVTTLPPLSRGATDVRRVQDLQALLNQYFAVVGGGQILVDGDFGPGTERAVQTFENNEGLPADGIVTESDLGVLQERIANG